MRSYVREYRSEGEAERDIGSTCMIGPGLVVVEKIFRRRRRRRRRRPLGVGPKKLGFCIKHIEYSGLGEGDCVIQISGDVDDEE